VKIRRLVQREYKTANPHQEIGTIEKQLLKHSYIVAMEQDSFRGIVTAADILQSPHQPVIDCIHPKPRVDSNEDIESVLELMRDKGEFVLPVFKNSGFIGVVVKKDILDYIRNLERRVTEQTQELTEIIDRLGKETEGCVRAEKALRKSEESFRTLIANATDGISVIRRDGSHIYVNRRAAEISGYSIDELLNMKMVDLIHPDERNKTINVLQKKFTGEYTPRQYETVVIRKDGKTVPVEVSESATMWGTEPASIVFIRDISDSKHVREALKESEQRYADIINFFPDPTFAIDNHGYVTAWDRAIEEMTGIKAKNMVGKSDYEYALPFYRTRRPMLIDIVQKPDEAIARQYTLTHKEKDTLVAETKTVLPDESIRFMWAKASLIYDDNGNITGSIESIRDITENKKAEEALRESEEKYRSLASTTDFMYLVDRNSRFLFMNEQYRARLNTDLKDTIGKRYGEFHSEKGATKFAEKVSKIFETGTSIQHEVRSSRDGKCFLRTLSPVRDEEGNTIAVTVASKDITDRIRIEAALRDSEEKYRTLIESTLDIIFKVDRNGLFTYVNPRFEEVVGYCFDEFIGRPFTYVVAPEQIESTVHRFKEVIRGKGLSPYEADLIHKNGEVIPVEFQVTTLYDDNGNPTKMFGVGRDLTERKRDEEERQRLEAQVQRAQKMEAVGTLAGGIAHDFNNLLMGIQGNTSLAILGMDSANPLYERLKNIEQQVRSGAELTKQLLGFARGGKYEVRPSNLSDLMETSSMLFGRTKKEIHIHRKYQEDIWMVDVDQGQIEQVLLNLYVNAWQAMPGGGELYLEAENVTLDEDYVKPYNLESGRYVKMSVTDNGVGMDEATLRRIFDPFFTTKEMGRGTGLGLASAYGIIQNHGGIINVYSEKGLGTTFNIYLPISEKKIMEEKKSSEEILLGTETVLLVDDEGVIADVGTEMLQMMGYDVFVARDGHEALMLYDENRDRIDMVILDMIMPEMSGGETFDRLKESNPEIKVLLSSGYSLNGRAKDIINRGCKGFIQKPFSVKDLSHKIRDVLDNH